MSPTALFIAAAVCFALFLGAMQSERDGDSNMLTPVLGLAWPLLLIGGVVLWIVHRRKPASADETKQCPQCELSQPMSYDKCVRCGHEFA